MEGEGGGYRGRERGGDSGRGRGGGYGGRGRGGRGGDGHRHGGEGHWSSGQHGRGGGYGDDRYRNTVEQPRASWRNNGGGGGGGRGWEEEIVAGEGSRRDSDSRGGGRWSGGHHRGGGSYGGDRYRDQVEQPRASWRNNEGRSRSEVDDRGAVEEAGEGWRRDSGRGGGGRWSGGYHGGGDRYPVEQPRASWRHSGGRDRDDRGAAEEFVSGEGSRRGSGRGGDGRGSGGHQGGGYGGDRCQNPAEQSRAPRRSNVGSIGGGRGRSEREPAEDIVAGEGSRGESSTAPRRDRQPMASVPSQSHSTESMKPSSDSHVSGMQSKAASQLFPIMRPDKGGTNSIRNVRLRANHFLVKYNAESTIMHYNVDVKPEITPKHGRSGRIPKADLSMIREKLFSDNPSEFPLSSTAYDGEKNIFSAVRLPTGKFRVEVSKGDDSKTRSYNVSINLVNELKLGKLNDYLRGCLTSIPRDILQGMDLVMKENPTRQMISVGRYFYPKVPDSTDDLGRGISAYKGFQHSLKPTSQGLSLCLDYSVLAFRKRMPVIEFLEKHIDGFNLNEFDRFRRDVEDALRGLKVYVNHRRTSQRFVVRGLTKRTARNSAFEIVDPDGKDPPRTVFLVQYFEEKYDKAIVHLDIPCLDLGKQNKSNDVPMEFCELVEGQRYHKEQLDKDAAQYLKTLSLPYPNAREQRIREMVQSRDGPCGGSIARNFGIYVNMNMTDVEGRVIGPPELKLGGQNGKLITVSVDKDKCQWNLVGKSLVQGKPIDKWGVLDFRQNDRGNNRFDLNPNIFIPKLIARCEKLGIRMAEPLFCESTSMRKFSSVNMLRELLEGISERAYKYSGGRLQLLVCAMNRRDPGYKYLKWICETKIGIVTQCCLSSHATKASDQYLANLALKINAKMGGSNVELSRLPLPASAGHVMFVGADVNHPTGIWNSMSPSIAAVVATVNWPAANRYAARVRAQHHGCERILDFGDMCLELIESYARLNKVRPEKIIIFRDGVSEGQFDMVLNEELLDLRRAFATINYAPTITLIVAQKRHQTRLFPHSRNDGCSTGNVPPGTVVDTRVVHPFEFDFYLFSHYGSLGTSKPTHYHVLYDEHAFSSDLLQKLIYDLCFTMARCTKPVSLVPPVYYADLAAYRGRIYHEASTESPSLPSAGSSSSSLQGSLSSVASFDERFSKLHADLENEMFFV